MSRECEKLQSSEMSRQEKQHKSGTKERPDSPVSSCVSLKSDKSLPLPLNFKGGTSSMESGTKERPDSPVSSCVSLKSDKSLPLPLNFKGGTSSMERYFSLLTASDITLLIGTKERPDSPVSSCVSLKSDKSLPLPLNFKGGTSSMERYFSLLTASDITLLIGTKERPDSPVSSCVSLKSDKSLPLPLNFTGGTSSMERYFSLLTASDITLLMFPRVSLFFTPEDTTSIISKKNKTFLKSLKLENKIADFLHNIFQDLENKMIVFIKHELEMFKKCLRKENTRYFSDVRDDVRSVKEAALDMTLYFLKLMEHNDLADALQDALIGVQQRALKSNLRKKACPEKQSYPGVSEQPGKDVAVPAGVVPPAATVRPAAEIPGAAAAPEIKESDPQAQPAAQKPTEATPVLDKPCLSDPALVKPRSAELTMERISEAATNQKKAGSAEPDREGTCLEKKAWWNLVQHWSYLCWQRQVRRCRAAAWKH
ncbi:hypothetical protein Q7C36_009322 [Tachysurus vachellii]|uniref:Uncharacterized protein n=1 Tax=Tachysurus vachellii TaxID=175792 RepID=A0AA88N4Y7_TACVA|nr:hypothetical protein Q7C36_009322 [Tachysurus vachellii]